ncbi:MAG: DUF805 domain-containing protein [Sphingobium sp.]|nr:DUF805 domain-containing protein [Sphingobium sp.]
MSTNFQSALSADPIDYDGMDFGNMGWRALYTRFDGEIGRKPFWIGFAGLMAFNIAMMAVVGLLVSIHPMLNNLAYLVSLALRYPSLALNAKRWHDRGKWGWWSAVLLVPFFGAPYAPYDLGIQPGAPTPYRPAR